MTVAPLPWDELADAYESLHESQRHGSAEDITLALERVQRAKEHCGNVGALLLTLAMDHGGLAVQKKLFGAIADGNTSTYRAAKVAVKLAKNLAAECDALRCELNELREMVARLTPGVGEPKFRIVG